jgi:hypothetical protein
MFSRENLMSTPLNRKLVQISTEAYDHLAKLREAEARRLNLRVFTLTDYVSNLILSTPVPGNGHKPENTPEEEQ